MGPFEMVVAIVFIIAVASVLRSRSTASADRDVEDQVARLRAQVEQLNDRVKVLEKLVTDPSKRLADEIERLRG